MPNTNHQLYGDKVQKYNLQEHDGQTVKFVSIFANATLFDLAQATTQPTKIQRDTVLTPTGLTSRKEKLNRQKRVKAVAEFTDNFWSPWIKGQYFRIQGDEKCAATDLRILSALAENENLEAAAPQTEWDQR